MKIFVLLLFSIFISLPVLAQELQSHAVTSVTSIGDSIDAAQIRKMNSKLISAGAVVGDPLGITMKYCISSGRALDISFGPDYFGSPRLQVDYVWIFNWFHSNIVKAYAGPGLAIAFAKGIKPFFSNEPFRENFSEIEDNGFGVGGRTIVGLNFSPLKSPIEYFVETGVLVSFTRYFDPDIDGAIGFRYRI